MSRRIALFLLLALLAINMQPTLANARASQQGNANDGLYFGKSGHTLTGQFLSFWRLHGGVDLLGRPLTQPINMNGLTIQYLERAILEYHTSSSQPVELGLLGNIVTAGRSFNTVDPFPNADDRIYFSATHHSLSDGFLQFWRGHGGLDIFGYPISEPLTEKAEFDGKMHIVQYFERTRLEWIPEQAGTPFSIYVGRLGNEAGQLPSFDRSLLARIANPGYTTVYAYYGKATFFSANWDRVISLNEKWGNLPPGYKGYGLYAAMPADLNLYGHWATVYYRDRSIRVQLIDVVAPQDQAGFRQRGRVIDLGKESFARLGSISDGVLNHVYVVTE